MINLALHFQVHQPWRLRNYRYSEVGKTHDYFDHEKNARLMRQISNRCYLPMNNLMTDLLADHRGAFKFSFAVSGAFLQQAEEYVPETIHSFKRLVETGLVELTSGTSHQSFASFLSAREFADQVKLHHSLCATLLRAPAPVFHNPAHTTGSRLTLPMATALKELGMKGVLLVDSASLLGRKASSYVYGLKKVPEFSILPRNVRLSDDVAFRFSDKTWPEHPLTPEKLVHWIELIREADPEEELFVGLVMDYETFGEHHKKPSGILEFMRSLPEALLETGWVRFVYPSQAVAEIKPISEVQPAPTLARQPLGSPIQDSAIKSIYRIEKAVKSADDPVLLEVWRRLTTSDHFHYMSTRTFNTRPGAGEFSPFESPYDAHIHFMNVLADLEYTLHVPPVEEERKMPA